MTVRRGKSADDKRAALEIADRTAKLEKQLGIHSVVTTERHTQTKEVERTVTVHPAVVEPPQQLPVAQQAPPPRPVALREFERLEDPQTKELLSVILKIYGEPNYGDETDWGELDGSFDELEKRAMNLNARNEARAEAEQLLGKFDAEHSEIRVEPEIGNDLFRYFHMLTTEKRRLEYEVIAYYQLLIKTDSVCRAKNVLKLLPEADQKRLLSATKTSEVSDA